MDQSILEKKAEKGADLDLTSADLQLNGKFNLDRLLDVCCKLEVPLTLQELLKWMDMIAAGDDNIPEENERSSANKLEAHVRRVTGSALVAELVYDLSDLLYQAHDVNNALVDPAKEYLKRRFTERPSQVIVEPRLLPPAPSFESRRTLMNTAEDRSANLDNPIKRYLELHPGKQISMIDFGVGFPPVTTLKTARLLKDCGRVIGIDSNIPDVIIRFPESEDFDYLAFYECNRESGEFALSHSVREVYGRIGGPCYENLDGEEVKYVIRAAEQLRGQLMAFHSEEKYRDMLALLDLLLQQPPNERANNGSYSILAEFCETDIADGRKRLCFSPMKCLSLQQPNLLFQKDGFTLDSIASVDIIRVGNVLMSNYYSAEETDAALKLLGRKVQSGGLLVVAQGNDFLLRYEKAPEELIAREIAIQLRYSCTPYVPGNNFPQYVKVFEDLQRACRSLDVSGYGIEWYRQSMPPPLAEQVRERLASQGYDVSCSFGSETYLHLRLDVT